MVSMTELSQYHGSAASHKRLKRRKAAELRLRAYGLIAIGLAGVALATLLWSVGHKAVGALSESYLTLPVTLSTDEIDPADPGKANYDGLTKDVLKETFPTVSGRSERRELYDLVSSGASFELRQRVLADPSLIGQTVEHRFLASDVADLYLKGEFGRLEPQTHSGTLTLTGDDDTVTVTSTEPDFAEALILAKQGLTEQARILRRQAALQDNGYRAVAADAEAATDPEDRAALQADADARAARRDQLLAEAEALETRATAEGGHAELDEAEPSVLLRVDGGWLKLTEITDTGGTAEIIVPPASLDAPVAPENWQYLLNKVPEQSRKVSDRQIVWIETLRERGAVTQVFNTRFFTSGDSREPELAGIWGAVVGSFWTMLVTILLAFPVGVLAAVYLEEFAPKNRITDIIEVNVNNLAAVPSIVFGLLGVAVINNFFGIPRSVPLAGGIVLAIMTLPTIIIAARASIAAVPPSIRDAALGIGASRLQATFHHVLPLGMPGILTGTIVGMARALGETAPLLMIGMVAFIADIPQGITDASSALPVQIYLWSDFPERAFEDRTAAAICALMVFLVLMNALAVFLRKRFERRW